MVRCTSEDETKVSVSSKVQQDLHQHLCSHLAGKSIFQRKVLTNSWHKNLPICLACGWQPENFQNLYGRERKSQNTPPRTLKKIGSLSPKLRSKKVTTKKGNRLNFAKNWQFWFQKLWKRSKIFKIVKLWFQGFAHLRCFTHFMWGHKRETLR